jgi:hypothetical protein
LSGLFFFPLIGGDGGRIKLAVVFDDAEAVLGGVL